MTTSGALTLWTRDEERQLEIVELFDEARNEYLLEEFAWIVQWWWDKDAAKGPAAGDPGHEFVLARARRNAAKRRQDVELRARDRAKKLEAADKRRAKAAKGRVCPECRAPVAPTKRMGRVPTLHPKCNRRRANRAWWLRRKERHPGGSARPTQSIDGEPTSPVET